MTESGVTLCHACHGRQFVEPKGFRVVRHLGPVKIRRIAEIKGSQGAR